VTADGGLAVCIKRKQLRFLQNNVISLSDYVQAEGLVTNQTYSPGGKVDSFRVGARLYDLISLGRIMQADDELDFVVERTVHNTFPAEHEWVTAEVLEPTDIAVIKLTWPQPRPPRNVRVEQTIEQRQTSREVEPNEFTNRPDGRTDLCQTIDRPPVGSDITVVRDW
jgi:hypothetical protein